MDGKEDYLDLLERIAGFPALDYGAGMNLPLDDAIILALLVLVVLIIIYERSRKPALLSNTRKLGKWVYLFSLALAASWAIVALVIYMSGGASIDVITLWVAAAIVWGGGWAYRHGLRR